MSSTHDHQRSTESANAWSSASSNSRKRMRTSGPAHNYETPYSVSANSWTSLNVDLSRSIGTASPPPLVNTKYRLAGGLDTPTREAAEQFESLEDASESDFRRRWTSSSLNESSRKRTIVVGALDREKNGHSRGGPPPTSTNNTWGQLVYNVVGGVAGKVWQFCRDSAFRGFTAGGGAAYELTASVPKPLTPGRRQQSRKTSTPVPGRYPDEEFEELHEPDLDMRPAKRLQTSQGKDWVVVNPSPLRPAWHSKASPASTTPGYRNVSGKAVNPRSSTGRYSRPSTARLSSLNDANTRAMGPQHARSASFASPRSREQSPKVPRSPASAAAAADVQKFAAKRQREERQADASMKKLNRQMKMMIRQGQEALESRIEIEDEEYASDEDMDEDDGSGVDRFGVA